MIVVAEDYMGAVDAHKCRAFPIVVIDGQYGKEKGEVQAEISDDDVFVLFRGTLPQCKRYLMAMLYFVAQDVSVVGPSDIYGQMRQWEDKFPD